jgi:hypothetical protein
VCPAPSPDFGGELLPFFLGGFVDDLAAGVVLASTVLHGCLYVLRQVRCAGVVLVGSSAVACPCHRDSETGITALAQPSQIFARSVRLVAVNVVDDEKAR